jgi:hypothetical protein
MIAPDRRTRRQWPMTGFVNQSGDGADASGSGSRLIRPQVSNVRVYRLSSEAAGLPCEALPARPQLDLSSPVRLT